MSKENIRRSALELFNLRGYDAASVRDITRAAGLSPSTFYSHYTSKDELYLDLVDECYEKLSGIMEETIRFSRELPADRRLYGILESRVNFFYEKKIEYLFLVRNSIFPPDSLREPIEKRIGIWEGKLINTAGEIIDKGKADGIISGLPSEELAKSLVRLIAGYGIQIITMHETPETSAENLQKAWEIYSTGILKSRN